MYHPTEKSICCFQSKLCFLGQTSVFSLQALRLLCLTLSNILTYRMKVNKDRKPSQHLTSYTRALCAHYKSTSSCLLPRRTSPALVFCHLNQNWPYTTTLTKFPNNSLHSPLTNKTPVKWCYSTYRHHFHGTTLQGDILGPLGESNSPAHPSGPQLGWVSSSTGPLCRSPHPA